MVQRCLGALCACVDAVCFPTRARIVSWPTDGQSTGAKRREHVPPRPSGARTATGATSGDSIDVGATRRDARTPPRPFAPSAPIAGDDTRMATAVVFSVSRWIIQKKELRHTTRSTQRRPELPARTQALTGESLLSLEVAE